MVEISKEEEEKIRQKIRAELEEEEKERLERLKHLNYLNEKEDQEEDKVDETKLLELKKIEIIENEKVAFYKEKGYIPVKTRSGKTKWISKEEYNEKKHKIRVKRRRNGKDLNPVEKPGQKNLKSIFIIILIFVLFSIFISLVSSIF